MDRTTRSTEVLRFTARVTPGAHAVGIRAVVALEELRGGIEQAGYTYAEYTAQHRDPRAVAAMLAKLPPVALCALEVIAELAGCAPTYLVEREVAERTKAPRKLVEQAILRAAGQALLVETRGREPRCFLVDCSAEAVARSVLGISLPVAPADLRAASPRGPAPSEAHRIAALAYLAHRAARPTLSHTIMHGTVKSIAKAIGGDTKVLDAWYRSALESGVLASRGSTVAPTFARLLAESDPATRAHDQRAPTAAWIPAKEWISLEALARADRRQQAQETMAAFLCGDHRVDLLADSRREVEEQLALCDGIDRVVQGGVCFFRRAPCPSGQGKDGYINPSFEVIVGPECGLASVVAIALGCELKRLDHFMTFALTPTSIANGASCGLTEPALREALAAASKHPIPENVDRSISDWFKRDVVLELHEAIVVTGPSALLVLIEKATEGWLMAPKRLGPEALAFDRTIPRRALETAIERAKGVLRCEADMGEAAMRKADREDDLEDEPTPASEVARAAPAPSFQGDPALRERFLRDIREKLALSKAAIAGHTTTQLPTPAATPKPVQAPPRRLCPECGEFHDSEVEHDDLDELDGMLEVLVARAAADLVSLVRKLSPADKGVVASLPLGLMTRFLCLSVKARKKVVERSHTAAQLLSNLAATETYSNDGADLLADEDEIDPAFLKVLLGEHGISWNGPVPFTGTNAPPANQVKAAAPSAPNAPLPPDPAPEEEAPAGAIRGRGPLEAWLRQRSRGDVAWLDLQTSDGALRGLFTIDAVQKRGKEIALLVSADWLDRGRVVFEREILAAADVG